MKTVEIWSTNSRVGRMTRALSLFTILCERVCTIGITYVRVFPDPVGAQTHMSFPSIMPFSMCGISWFWIGNRWSIPMAERLLMMEGDIGDISGLEIRSDDSELLLFAFSTK